MGTKSVLRAVLFFLLVGVCAICGLTQSAFAEDLSAEYQAVYFDKSTGLVASEINTIIQTADGYIWIGTYSGLYRYNGFRFEKISLDKRLSSIMTMFVDSKNYLWIGTNDSGLARYNLETHELVFYTKNTGLGANSVRTLCEDASGNIFVGTVSWMSEITADGRMITFSDWKDINYVKSIVEGDDGIVAGVTNGGVLFFMRNGKIIARDYYDAKGGVYYTTIARNEFGDYLVGTSTNIMLRMQFIDGKVVRREAFESQNLMYHHKISYNYDLKGYYFCAENGMGFITNDGICSTFSNVKVCNSITDILIDYQNNIWVVSSKQGIMELTKSPFVDVFKKSGIASSVVNALQFHNNDLYIGMDTGLYAVDKETFRLRQYDFLQQFNGVRVRHILEDSHKNVWVCTYGKMGLSKIDPSGKVTVFNEALKQTLGGRFRVATELADGTILVASNIGLNYIQNDTVIHTLGESDGMNTPQILTIVQKPDGSILAGSDGDGIYVIKDKKIVRTIGMEDGLENLVVLRIVPGSSGYFYITSSAIFYDDENTIRRLDNFPYNNNFDMRIFDYGDAWITSSAGIYVVREKDMIQDDQYGYTLLDYNRGFDTSPVSNSWNVVDSQNILYLCCNDGVRCVDPKKCNNVDTHYGIQVHSFEADGSSVPQINGIYHIPAKAKRVTIQPAVLNFALTNPLVHVYLDGSGDSGIQQHQKELTPLSFTNLPFGKYTLRVQILDVPSNKVLREELFSIEKPARFYEKIYFKMLLVIILMALVAFCTWMIVKIKSMAIINKQYEQIRDAKDEAEKANKSKTQFLENISYEIRTPLTTVIGMNELVLRESTQELVRQYASHTIHAGYVLQNLVSDIVDFANIDSGSIEILEREYSLGQLLCDVELLCIEKAKQKKLDFDIVVDKSLPDALYGDGTRLRQVITNVLYYGIEHTVEGAVELSVLMQSSENDILTLRFEVSYTGVMVKDEANLGLSLSDSLVKIMHGTFACDRTYIKGSRFIITIPQQVRGNIAVGDYRNHKELLPEENSFEKISVPSGTRILVVDDNEMNRVILREMLTKSGIAVVEADSGIKALQLVGEEHFDIIFLDHVMPEMDGLETFERMRAMESNKCSNAPVIALTANDLDGSEAFYLSKGFSDYLSKPVSYDLVIAIIKKYLVPRG
ncbi:MAG: response regulator [Treponema sp.]|nr:response regulator [Treponema sp.]